MIKEIDKSEIYYVTTDEKEYNEYIRYSSNNWMVKIGESEEPLYDCEELEAEFQRAMEEKQKEAFYVNEKMNIDTEFYVGDNVCYLSGDDIYYSTISKITIEISHSDRSFLMVYKLSDGFSVPRNNYPKWDKRLFRDKESLIKYLSEFKCD